MGLDGVEILMKVEDTFDISIQDSDAEKIVTPGQLIDLVFAKVGRTDRAVCLTQRAFHAIRRTALDHLKVKRHEIRLDTKLRTLLPPDSRMMLLEAMLKDLSLDSKIAYELPGTVSKLILVGAVVVGAMMFCAAKLASSGGSILWNLLIAGPLVCGVFAAICAAAIGLRATRSFAKELPGHLVTVEDLTRWVVAQNPPQIGAPPGQWTREQIAEKVRLIVIEALALTGDEYSEDARFVQDLGMS